MVPVALHSRYEWCFPMQRYTPAEPRCITALGGSEKKVYMYDGYVRHRHRHGMACNSQERGHISYFIVQKLSMFNIIILWIQHSAVLLCNTLTVSYHMIRMVIQEKRGLPSRISDVVFQPSPLCYARMANLAAFVSLRHLIGRPGASRLTEPAKASQSLNGTQCSYVTRRLMRPKEPLGKMGCRLS